MQHLHRNSDASGSIAAEGAPDAAFAASGGGRQEPLCVRILLPSRCRRKCWLSQFSRVTDKDRAKSKGKWQMANGKWQMARKC
jgi:hypothetical protein